MCWVTIFHNIMLLSNKFVLQQSGGDNSFMCYSQCCPQTEQQLERGAFAHAAHNACLGSALPKSWYIHGLPTQQLHSNQQLNNSWIWLLIHEYELLASTVKAHIHHCLFSLFQQVQYTLSTWSTVTSRLLNSESMVAGSFFSTTTKNFSAASPNNNCAWEMEND